MSEVDAAKRKWFCQPYLQKIARLPVHFHPQESQLVVGGGVKSLVVAGIYLLSPIATHELASKAHCHLLQLHLLCTYTPPSAPVWFSRRALSEQVWLPLCFSWVLFDGSQKVLLKEEH